MFWNSNVWRVIAASALVAVMFGLLADVTPGRSHCVVLSVMYGALTGGGIELSHIVRSTVYIREMSLRIWQNRPSMWMTISVTLIVFSAGIGQICAIAVLRFRVGLAIGAIGVLAVAWLVAVNASVKARLRIPISELRGVRLYDGSEAEGRIVLDRKDDCSIVLLKSAKPARTISRILAARKDAENDAS